MQSNQILTASSHSEDLILKIKDIVNKVVKIKYAFNMAFFYDQNKYFNDWITAGYGQYFAKAIYEFNDELKAILIKCNAVNDFKEAIEGENSFKTGTFNPNALSGLVIGGTELLSNLLKKHLLLLNFFDKTFNVPTPLIMAAYYAYENFQNDLNSIKILLSHRHKHNSSNLDREDQVATVTFANEALHPTFCHDYKSSFALTNPSVTLVKGSNDTIKITHETYTKATTLLSQSATSLSLFAIEKTINELSNNESQNKSEPLTKPTP